MIFINSPSSGCPTTTVQWLLVFDLQTDINDQQYVKQWNKMLEFPEHEVFTNRHKDMINTNENVKLLNKIPPFFVGSINRWTTSLGRFKPVFATFACNHIYVYIIYIRTFFRDRDSWICTSRFNTKSMVFVGEYFIWGERGSVINQKEHVKRMGKTNSKINYCEYKAFFLNYHNH